MVGHAALDAKPGWPQPDESGRVVLKASMRQRIGYVVFFSLFTVGGLLIAWHPHHPADVVKGYLCTALFGALSIVSIGTLVSGRADLVLDDAGFSQRQKHYAWADCSRFTPGAGREKLLVHVTVAGKRVTLSNLYDGMTTAQLAEFLNSQLGRNGGGLPRGVRPPPRMPLATAKRLQVLGWVVIAAVIIASAVMPFLRMKRGG
jgi:hypothetical protein